jgi:DNA repair protein RadC
MAKPILPVQPVSTARPLKIAELPEQERPREKLAARGAATLTDAELVAILLRTGVKGRSAIDLGRELIERFGSLNDLARATVAQMAALKGMGLAKAVQLAAAFGLGSRLARERLDRVPMSRPELFYELLGSEMQQLMKESLRTVLLDTRLRLIRVEEIHLGSLNESLAHPREIFRPAIHHGAHAFVLVHNHPSGDPAPSEADRRLTVRIREAASLLQVEFLDHIIIGSPCVGRAPYFSFREAAVL